MLTAELRRGARRGGARGGAHPAPAGVHAPREPHQRLLRPLLRDPARPAPGRLDPTARRVRSRRDPPARPVHGPDLGHRALRPAARRPDAAEHPHPAGEPRRALPHVFPWPRRHDGQADDAPPPAAAGGDGHLHAGLHHRAATRGAYRDLVADPGRRGPGLGPRRRRRAPGASMLGVEPGRAAHPLGGPRHPAARPGGHGRGAARRAGSVTPTPGSPWSAGSTTTLFLQRAEELGVAHAVCSLGRRSPRATSRTCSPPPTSSATSRATAWAPRPSSPWRPACRSSAGAAIDNFPGVDLVEGRRDPPVPARRRARPGRPPAQRARTSPRRAPRSARAPAAIVDEHFALERVLDQHLDTLADLVAAPAPARRPLIACGRLTGPATDTPRSTFP